MKARTVWLSLLGLTLLTLVAAACVPLPPSSAPVAPSEVAVPRPSAPGGPGPALDLAGDAASGARIFETSCQVCHGVGGKGVGAADTTKLDAWQVVPPLVPAPAGLADPDPKVFAENLDLFIEHGSTPYGGRGGMYMLPFGDSGLLTPQEIADVIAYIIAENSAPAASAVPRPSVPGGPGPALDLTGDAASGAQIFATSCQVCHGVGGKGVDATDAAKLDAWQVVPPLVPAPSGLADPDPKVFAENLDLFIEHGSTPYGGRGGMYMLPFGDSGLLTPQEIADVIAYIIAQNSAPAESAVPRPSVPGGPGPALNLTGDAASGAGLFEISCQVCHGVGGKGVSSSDATKLDAWQVVPPLVPAPAGLADPDPKVFAENLDLFIEHGSTPYGGRGGMYMLPFGDSGLLTPQEIADIIAFIIEQQ